MLRDIYIQEVLIDIDNYEIQDRIGNGAFGIVFKAKQKDNNEIVALKALQPNDNLKRQKDQRNILNEICIPHVLNLPGVVELKGFRFPLTDEQKATEKIKSIDTKNKKGQKEKVDLTGAIIITQFKKNGSLETLTDKYLESKGAERDKMNPTIRSKIIFGIAATMKQVHQKNVIHRDLKPDNIFLDDNLEPQIADFGLSKVIMNKIDMTMVLGTPFFMAPELFMDGDEGSYTVAVDVYAFAFIIYKMFTNKILFADKRPIRSHQQYMMKIGKGLRPVRPDSIPDKYWDLIQHCWDQEPSSRPTFEDITEILKDDAFAIEEFGMKTDLARLHEYQKRIDSAPGPKIPSSPVRHVRSSPKVRKTHFNWKRH
ncbi:hypothetical protein M9Y10_035383 [Tritrichomonas musculus]|uniref:Protein kinase domain-containing protein n=1 Tax=Tritrichomonas musculus TaxID=1915356 RepID=A0ABR2KHH8_9EUKA